MSDDHTRKALAEFSDSLYDHIDADYEDLHYQWHEEGATCERYASHFHYVGGLIRYHQKPVIVRPSTRRVRPHVEDPGRRDARMA